MQVMAFLRKIDTPREGAAAMEHGLRLRMRSMLGCTVAPTAQAWRIATHAPRHGPSRHTSVADDPGGARRRGSAIATLPRSRQRRPGSSPADAPACRRGGLAWRRRVAGDRRHALEVAAHQVGRRSGAVAPCLLAIDTRSEDIFVPGVRRIAESTRASSALASVAENNRGRAGGVLAFTPPLPRLPPPPPRCNRALANAPPPHAPPGSSSDVIVAKRRRDRCSACRRTIGARLGERIGVEKLVPIYAGPATTGAIH